MTPLPAGVTRIKETNCLNCGHRLNNIFGVDHNDPPESGAPVACIKCAAVMIWDSGELRPFTDAEAQALADDAETMAYLARAVGGIRILRAMQN